MAISKQNLSKMYEAFRQENPNYFNRLDPVTVDNVLDVGGQIADNNQMFTDFIRVLEKVALTYVNSVKFQNPLARNKNATTEYGTIIEEIFVGLVKSKVFRSEDPAADLFRAEKPNVDAVYYQMNREESYKTTVDAIRLRQGMRNEDGVSNIVDSLIASLSTSNEADEYKLMKALLEGAYKKGDMYYIAVGDVGQDGEVGRNAARKMTKKSKEYGVLVRFLNNYNARGVETTTTQDSMTLYTTAKVGAELDVEVLANAFNQSAVSMETRKVLLDKFADDNLLAVLVDDAFFVVHDHYKNITHQYDASAEKINYWLHVMQTIARSPFATAIAFVKEIPEDTQARLVVDPVVDIIGRELDYSGDASITVGTKLEGFDGTTDDLTDYTVEATVDSDAVDVSVDPETNAVTITANDNASPGESVVVTFTASYGAELDKEVSVKGQYTISKNIHK